jgi:hypothetical protein
LRRNIEDYRDYDEASDNRGVPNERNLVALHTRLIKSLQVNNRTENMWSKMIEEAFFVEDVLLNETNTNRRFVFTTAVRKSFVFRVMNNPLIG